jgi:hypothetical protein
VTELFYTELIPAGWATKANKKTKAAPLADGRIQFSKLLSNRPSPYVNATYV